MLRILNVAQTVWTMRPGPVSRTQRPHRDDGNEADALALERAAEALRIRAEKIRRAADNDSAQKLK